MSSSGYSFCPQSPSFLAMKYLRTYVPTRSRSLAPGQRYRMQLDMEDKVEGYRDIVRGMREASVEIDRCRRLMTSPDREVCPPVSLQTPGIGYTSYRSNGNIWRHDFYPNTVRFVPTGSRIYHEAGLSNTYRYYMRHGSRMF